jgi:HSP20 family protein
MATDTAKRHEKNEGSNVEMTHTSSPSPRSTPSRWQGQGNYASSGPFGLMRQMQDDVDRWFGRFGFSSPTNWLTQTAGTAADWAPAIDAFQRGNEFVIRADLPGMNRTDLSVEVGDDAVTIRGERKHEIEEDRDGVFWSERSYGSFSRVVPIPPAAIGESAKATFTNGVLEVVMSAPSQEARRGRKIDISGSRDEKKTA